LSTRKAPKYTFKNFSLTSERVLLQTAHKSRVAVIREEGSNGDREMSAAFYMANFEVWDIKMSDFVHSNVTLDNFRGIIFVGGFSYADVMDSAKGWAAVINFNNVILKQFKFFYERKDTFSFGVCNGCQLMALLGWPLFPTITDSKQQPRFISNLSGRFESRFSTVTIQPSNAIMVQGMEGSILGIWVSHGEGRAYFPEPQILDQILMNKQAPIRYVDDDGNVTEKYPFNPNGSVHGIAALCSKDGRHLVMMPHPERTVLKWQWPYLQYGCNMDASPWLKMFQNVREWCENTTR